MARIDEFNQKRQQLLEYMDNHHLDAVILTRRCNFAWLTAGGLNHVSTAADLGAASLLVTARHSLHHQLHRGSAGGGRGIGRPGDRTAAV